MKGEIFHLYGMKFFISGDLEKARALASHARKLQFQLGLSDVPKIQNVFHDGSSVRVLRQAGQDFAHIHVPPVSVVNEMVRERIEYRYIPAFDAYDQNNIFIGYVLCLGPGFNGPYEFIPQPSLGEIAPFSWGRWLGWYSERPFDDLEAYLRHKLVYSINGRELWEIPPHGTNNRIFESLVSAHHTEVNSITGSPQCEECCYDGTPGTSIYQYSLEDTFSIDVSGGYEKKFTIGDTGDYEPTIIYEDGAEGYEVLDHVIEIPSSTLNESGETFGTLRYSAGVTAASSCDEAKTATPESYKCPALISAYSGETISPAGWTALYDPIRDCTYGVTFPGTTYDARVTSYEASSNRSRLNERYSQSEYSSAYDKDHFGIVFLNRNRTTIGNRFVTWSNCPLSTECAPEVISTETISNSQVSAVLSGTEYKIGHYTDAKLNSIYESDCWSDFPIRYYQDGSLEFLLGGVLMRDTNIISRYFFIMQTATQTVQFDDTAILNSDSMYYTDLADIKYNDQPIRMKHEFRLFKEIKTIKEASNE